MKLDGVPFKNSETCEGIAYVAENAPLDLSVIRISGRYPERGWAVNETVHEIVLVRQGSGNLALKDAELQSLCEGDVAVVSPGQRFAWQGEMELVMACSPQFTANQYKMETA